MTAIPHASDPLLDSAGRLTRSWRIYLSSLSPADASAELQQQINALREVVDGLSAGGSDASIIGMESVFVFGTLADGTVWVKLRNDASAPGVTRYYGTGPDGTKGWHAIADALDVDSGELVKAVDPDTGVTTLGLAELPDTGGGELLKIVRDAYGRVAGTSSAEAPQDGKQYARQDGDWSEVQSSGGGVLPMVNGEAPPVLMYGGNQLIYARVE